MNPMQAPNVGPGGENFGCRTKLDADWASQQQVEVIPEMPAMTEFCKTSDTHRCAQCQKRPWLIRYREGSLKVWIVKCGCGSQGYAELDKGSAIRKWNHLQYEVKRP